MMVKEVWGLRPCEWLMLPSWGASGGILLIWDPNKVDVLDHDIGAYSISPKCKLKRTADEWVFVGVYGPFVRSEADDFLWELDVVNAHRGLPWCIGGDFNLIRLLSDRSGGVSNDSGLVKK